jgi:hypothetical protein
MPKSKPSTGLMKTQPIRQGAISPALPMMPTFGDGAKIAKPSSGPTGMDAARATKAKITRRKSLQKQRDGQKAKPS